jgi:hypothetical protein
VNPANDPAAIQARQDAERAALADSKMRGRASTIAAGGDSAADEQYGRITTEALNRVCYPTRNSSVGFTGLPLSQRILDRECSAASEMAQSAAFVRIEGQTDLRQLMVDVVCECRMSVAADVLCVTAKKFSGCCDHGVGIPPRH